MKRRLRERFWTLSRSQHFLADVHLEWKEFAEQHEFHPRGPLDAPSEDFLLRWVRRQVRLHGKRDHSHWCLRELHRGTNAQRGWWLRVKGQMLVSDRDIVTVR